MSQDSLQQFYEKFLNDSVLQEKLYGATAEKFCQSFVDMGAEKGYNFTKDEVEAALDSATGGLREEQLSQKSVVALATATGCATGCATRFSKS